MTNIINLPAFIYPRYSDFYLSKKKELENRMKDELKSINDMQAFYETCVSILKRFQLSRPTYFKTYTTGLVHEVKLLETDSISILFPLLNELKKHFYCSVYFSPFSDSVEFYFRARPGSSGHITVKAELPYEGLTDIKLVKKPRVTTTTETDFIYDHNLLEAYTG